MMRSHTLQIELDGIEQRRRAAQAEVRRLSMLPAEQRASDETETALRAQSAALDALDREHDVSAAKREEAAAAEQRELDELKTRIGGGDLPNVPPEMRSFIDLEQRASLGDFVSGDLSETALVQGAEKEYRAAVIEDIGGQHPALPFPVPWSMFLPPERLRELRSKQIEARAVLGGSPTGGTMQDPIIADVFAASTAAFLGTRFSSAGTGQVIEYVLTSSGASLVAASAAHTAAGSLAATTLTPKSIRTKYELQVEQVATIRGVEAAIRADVPRAIMAQIDNQVLNRGGTNRFANGILRAFALPATEATDTNSFALAIAKGISGIDGKFARSPAELKTVVGPETMQSWATLIAGNTAVSAYDYLKMVTGGIMATDHIDVHNTDNQYGIICKTGPGMMGNIAAKMWGGGVQIKRDDSSSAVAEKGEVHVNATALADFAVLRAAGFQLYDVKFQ